jgi:hypothetical protein
MSDNESFDSHTETEGSTDNEDIAEQSSVFSHTNLSQSQIVTTRKTNSTDEDGILRETLEARFKKNVAVNSW